MTSPPNSEHRARMSGAKQRRQKRRIARIRGETPGGVTGAGALSCAWNPTFTRRDLIDIRRAVRGGWVTSPEMRAAILARVEKTLDASADSPRLSIGVALVVLAMSDADRLEARKFNEGTR